VPASGSPARSYGGEPLEARRRDQRERLLGAAREAFAAKGYAGTSIEDVVAGARVSRTAFYRFFANKEECMLAVFEQGTGRTLEALEEVARADLDPLAKVAAGVRVFVETLAQDPAMAKLILIEAVGVSPAVEDARHAARMEFAAVIEKELRATGLWKGRPKQDLRLIAMATMAGLAEAVEYLVATEAYDDREAMIGVLTGYAQRALAPP
jgi:AcrR family transcriptional regulator